MNISPSPGDISKGISDSLGLSGGVFFILLTFIIKYIYKDNIKKIKNYETNKIILVALQIPLG